VTDELDNVIAVSFGQVATVKDRHSDPVACAHRTHVLYEVDRSVRCGACGTVLDAFDALSVYARQEDRWRSAQVRYRELVLAVDALRKEEDLVKARLKSASRKDAKNAVAHERARLKEQERRTASNAREIILLAQRIVRASGEKVDRLSVVEQDEESKKPGVGAPGHQ
jgi:hypothetical protein